MAADARSRFFPCRCSLEYVGGTAGERTGSLCHATPLMARTLHALPAACCSHSLRNHEYPCAPWQPLTAEIVSVARRTTRPFPAAHADYAYFATFYSDNVPYAQYYDSKRASHALSQDPGGC